MAGTKTNERPGTRAVLRHCRMSAFKARQVLDLIRGVEYQRATEILQYCDREAADVIGKLLHSAAANAEHNDELESDDLYVSACYADEGATAKRWRPRARGRVTRIRKRTCHITVILSRLPEEEIRKRRAKVAAEQADRRARRVAGARRQRRGAEELSSAPSGDETPSYADDNSSSPADGLDLADQDLAAAEGEEEEVEDESEEEATAPADSEAVSSEPASEADGAVASDSGATDEDDDSATEAEEEK